MKDPGRYPWELDWEIGESPVEHFWTTDLKSNPQSIWPLLSDTSAVNALLGLPVMRFEERNGQLHGSSGRFLTRQEWVEVPWEWEVEKSLTAERRYSKGFAQRVRVRYLLSDRFGGTRLTIYFGWIPRRWWFRPVLKWANRWLQKRYDEALTKLDAMASNPLPSPRQHQITNEGVVDEARLREGVSYLTTAGIASVEAERLATHLREAPDQELFRIRPKVLAFDWGMELYEVLCILLYSTKAGLLAISWDIMCPHCKGVRKEVRSLGELREFDYCAICDIDFSANAQDSIEVTFKVLPEIREVLEVFYCSAEPAKKPHVLLQQHVAMKTTFETDVVLTEGRYRLRYVGGDGPSHLLEVTQADGLAEVSWVLNEEKISKKTIAIKPSVRFVVVNPEEYSKSIILEKLAEDPSCLKPSELFNLQQFRELFSEESITSGLKLEVGAQTLLFTDIVGSSALYALQGDAVAFNSVRAHFIELQAIITSMRGAVVKTIGDAMMAAFSHPDAALAAAIEIQRKFRPGIQDIALRVSVHRGTCIAVRLDSNIDYFGSTVNYAAKMQKSTKAGQIALSKAFHCLPSISSDVEQCGMEREEVKLQSSYGDENTVFILSQSAI